MGISFMFILSLSVLSELNIYSIAAFRVTVTIWRPVH